MKKPTLVLGASEKTDRYSNRAVKMLLQYGHPVLAIGKRKGRIDSVLIEIMPEVSEPIDTLTMYLNPENQKLYYDFILFIKPKRIIFNPGTENPDFFVKAEIAGIQCVKGCTLVMLQTGQY